MAIDEKKMEKVRSYFDRWFPGYSESAGLSVDADAMLREVVNRAIKLMNVESFCEILGCDPQDAKKVKSAYQSFLNYVAEEQKMRSVPPPSQNTKIPQHLLFGFLDAVTVPLIQQSEDGVIQAIRRFLLEDEIDDMQLSGRVQQLFEQTATALAHDYDPLEQTVKEPEIKEPTNAELSELYSRISALESAIRSAGGAHA